MHSLKHHRSQNSNGTYATFGGGRHLDSELWFCLDSRHAFAEVLNHFRVTTHPRKKYKLIPKSSTVFY